tara:strand:+ start:390 stop:566 length:177 start_codon:yes stop_codon:yes gene_type:complete
MKKLTKLYLEFFPIYGLALGITYSSEEQEEEEILEYGDEHIVQFYLLVFGFSIIYSLK